MPTKKEKQPLSVTHPELAKEAAGWDPSTVTFGSERKKLWKCPKGHIFESTPATRTRSNTGCPFCSGNKTLPGFNDLGTTHPELAKQALGWDPTTVTYGSELKKLWKCEKGHEWIISPNGRTSKGGTNCPYCANQKLLVGYNDLRTTHPELAAQASGWNPESMVAGNKKKMKWECGFGHQWEATVASRSGIGLGCPICSNKSVLKGFNDLATTNPLLAAQAHGWDPTTVTKGSGKSREWICQEGHLWNAGVGARSSQNEGCPFCSNQKILVGDNDIKSTHPKLASEADGWDPTKFNAGSTKRVSWICPLGHKYSSRIVDRGRRNTNCSVCAGRILLKGFNDLKTSNPELAMEAFGWDPETIGAGTHKKLKWKCSEDHIWLASVANRNGNRRGCPTCSKTGFDPNQDGYLYFLAHASWVMFQIGITNYPDKRMLTHAKLGWEILEIRGPMDGHLTQQWETAILRMLKSKGADLSNSKIAGKFDGYSEAWSESTFEAKSIKELMRLTEEFEGK